MTNKNYLLFSNRKFAAAIVSCAVAFIHPATSVSYAEELQIIVLEDAYSDLSALAGEDTLNTIGSDESGSAISTSDVDDTVHLHDLQQFNREGNKPHLVSVSHYQDDWEGENQLIQTEWTTMLLENQETYPALYEALLKQAELEQQQGRENYDTLAEDARSAFEMSGFVYTHSYDSSIMVRRADEKVVSLLYQKSQYAGGAHGYSWYEGQNYNSQTGERIQLSELITSSDTLLQVIYDKLCESYQGLSGLDPSNEFGYWNTVNTDNLVWTMEPESMTFYFAAYTLGSYAESSQIITVPYSEYPDLFTDLTQYDETSHVSEILYWCPAVMDIDSDGSAEIIETQILYSEEYGYAYPGFKILINNQEYTYDVEFYSVDFSLVKHNGSAYLYAFLSVEDDQSQFVVIDLSGGVPAHVDTIDYGYVYWDGEYSTVVYQEHLTDPEHFHLAARTDVLGTAKVAGSFSVREGGQPVLTSEELYVIQSRTLTAKQEITGELIEIQEGEVTLTGEAALIQSGDSVTVFGTDNQSYADLQKEDSSIIRIPIELTDYPQTSDGVDVEELFDHVIFVG